MNSLEPLVFISHECTVINRLMTLKNRLLFLLCTSCWLLCIRIYNFYRTLPLLCLVRQKNRTWRNIYEIKTIKTSAASPCLYREIMVLFLPELLMIAKFLSIKTKLSLELQKYLERTTIRSSLGDERRKSLMTRNSKA